jgi:hypothetical protein
MGANPGIYIDKSLLLGNCSGETGMSGAYCLFDYLERHPAVGITTNYIEDSVRYRIGHMNRAIDTERASDRLDNVMAYLKKEEIEKKAFDKNLTKVESFFKALLRYSKRSLGFDPSLTMSQYFKISANVNGSRIKEVVQMPPHEDKIVLAEAFSLSKAYNPLILASSDINHLCGKGISSKIEEKFGVKCVKPMRAIKELEKYEHLFKEKVIS